MHKLIKQYCIGREEESKVKKDSPKKEVKDEEEDIVKSPKKYQQSYKIKHNSFIIQKYIEKPLLLKNRKFDIRVWIFVSQDFDVYFFKEGYLRTSSSEYQIDLNNIDNQFVHLTNNAVQKYSQTYGDFEDGNQLSYQRFQEILDEDYSEHNISVYNDIVPHMKELIIKSLYSVRKKIDPFRRKYCFELFGYDFIIDQDFNIWLIEVNTNPCIEESSELLKILLPRMIEDMLKLTIDQVFPKYKIKRKSKDSPIKSKGKGTQNNSILEQIEEENNELVDNFINHHSHRIQDSYKKNNSRVHPVKGYPNNVNMWEKIWNLDKQDMPSYKHPNNKSMYYIQINEKNLKIKKNSLFVDCQKEQLNVDK